MDNCQYIQPDDPDLPPDPEPVAPEPADAELDAINAQIKVVHFRYKKNAVALAKEVIELRHLLIKAKKRVKHGNWGLYVGATYDFSYRSACLYMRIARKGFKPAMVADLGLQEAALPMLKVTKKLTGDGQKRSDEDPDGLDPGDRESHRERERRHEGGLQAPLSIPKPRDGELLTIQWPPRSFGSLNGFAFGFVWRSNGTFRVNWDHVLQEPSGGSFRGIFLNIGGPKGKNGAWTEAISHPNDGWQQMNEHIERFWEPRFSSLVSPLPRYAQCALELWYLREKLGGVRYVKDRPRVIQHSATVADLFLKAQQVMLGLREEIEDWNHECEHPGANTSPWVYQRVPEKSD